MSLMMMFFWASTIKESKRLWDLWIKENKFNDLQRAQTAGAVVMRDKIHKLYFLQELFERIFSKEVENLLHGKMQKSKKGKKSRGWEWKSVELLLPGFKWKGIRKKKYYFMSSTFHSRLNGKVSFRTIFFPSSKLFPELQRSSKDYDKVFAENSRKFIDLLIEKSSN